MSTKRMTASKFVLFLLICINVSSLSCQTYPPVQSSDFASQYLVSWSADHVRTASDGSVSLILDYASGGGYGSKNLYTFGYVSTQIKLVPGDSAGTVTAYYLSSDMSAADHEELDIEFLGNKSGQPYILQTNIYVNGVGDREQRHYLWFDPTADYHTYSVLWNKYIVIFSVDSRPIRIYKNNGVDYPQFKPMAIYASLWNGDDWATRGGLDKIDWSVAPFEASFRTFTIDACVNNNGANAGACANTIAWWSGSSYQDLDASSRAELDYIKRTYMVYDYCTDVARNPVAPAECATN